MTDWKTNCFRRTRILSTMDGKIMLLEVAEDNTTILPIYFGVNGTSANDKDICLTMEIDPDTLQKYNWEKYKNQSDLYYKILPAGTYTFDADSWTIPSGELECDGCY